MECRPVAMLLNMKLKLRSSASGTTCSPSGHATQRIHHKQQEHSIGLSEPWRKESWARKGLKTPWKQATLKEKELSLETVETSTADCPQNLSETAPVVGRIAQSIIRGAPWIPSLGLGDRVPQWCVSNHLTLRDWAEKLYKYLGPNR